MKNVSKDIKEHMYRAKPVVRHPSFYKIDKGIWTYLRKQPMFTPSIRIVVRAIIQTMFLLCIALTAHSQVSLEIRNKEPFAVTDINHAAIIEYWGRKGIASVPYIQNSELKIQLLETENSLYKSVADNHQKAAEEYRSKLEALAREREGYTKDLLNLTADMNKWKDKAQNRAKTIGILSAVLGVIIYINLSK